MRTNTACPASAARSTGPFRASARRSRSPGRRARLGIIYNATWPGAVGVLSAMAPGRFCAVINQAPMKRRTQGKLGFPYDAAINLRNALASEGDWPPDHLLRYAFETCETFEEAVELIASAPLARPTLFTLAGVKRGEMALIERTEREARVLRGPVIVVNDWQEPQQGWQARMSYENNESRKTAMRAVASDAPRFSWVREPVLNRLTRLAVEMCSVGVGDFVARGYECPYLKAGRSRRRRTFICAPQRRRRSRPDRRQRQPSAASWPALCRPSTP